MTFQIQVLTWDMQRDLIGLSDPNPPSTALNVRRVKNELSHVDVLAL
jgi:hypothetical protein